MRSERRERAYAAVREEILANARHLLTTGGPEAITVRAVAREMGLTAPALSRYYGSRAHLLTAVQQQISQEIGATISTIPETADDPVGTCRARGAQPGSVTSVSGGRVHVSG